MIVLFLMFCACVQAQVKVTTTEGVVVGNQAPDGNYTAFFGIPYAGNVAGSNRFKHAPPPEKHTILETDTSRDVICAQPGERGIIGEEDCLRLNIFTRNVTMRKPVLVWLNAEDYSTTNNRPASFKTFVESDIVVVSLNFRLSIFGFLCLGVEAAPGNAGIKDIVQGLQWINKNIAGFGGDPNNVMLMGHGSAAALVDIITMVPQAQNLVHKAVALSGSALAPWALSYNPVQSAIAFADSVGFSTNNKSPEKIAEQLIQIQASFLNEPLIKYKYPNNTLLFAPCVENGKVYPNETVLTEAPYKMLQEGNFSHIPYIAAYVTEEGTIRAEEAVLGNWLQKMNDSFDEFLPVDIDYGKNRTLISQNIKNTYFNGTIDIQDYLDFIGDTSVVVSVIRGAALRANKSRSSVRLMEFGYRGQPSYDWVYPQIPLDGVQHGEILNYLFNYHLGTSDIRVMDSVVTRFSTFARSGTPVLTFDRSNHQWSAITSSQLLYLEDVGSAATLTYQVQERQDPHSILMKFWNDLYDKHYLPPSPVSSASQSSSTVCLTVLLSLLLSKFLL